MARALIDKGHEALVYRAVCGRGKMAVAEMIQGVKVCYLPAKHIGVHSIFNPKYIGTDYQYLFCFSDQQFMLPSVFHWCRKNHIVLCAMVGVMGSNNDNVLLSRLSNLLYKRNMNYYRRMSVIAKTMQVERYLSQQNVSNVKYIPPGLDRERLKENFRKTDRNALREKLGYCVTDKIVLFVGRMEPEKEPLRAIDLFVRLCRSSEQYRCIMIGKGSMAQKTDIEIEKNNLKNVICRIDTVTNDTIWNYYYISDFFLNMNKHEIFGMAILEAMYYETVVVAHHAPGPDAIVQSGETGYLYETESEAMQMIQSCSIQETIQRKASVQIQNNYLWDILVDAILEYAEGITGENTN